MVQLLTHRAHASRVGPAAPMADARNATAWLPLPSVFCPARRAVAIRLSPTGWHGCRFPLVRPHRMRNGIGKTTTVRILATLTRADGGRARVAGFDVLRDRPQVRRRISLTGQFAALDEAQTGEENLRMMGRLSRLSRAAARQRAAELLEQFELTAAGRRRVGTYSGGMRRRLDLAASLVGRPSVIFLDEPTTGLDPAKREDMWDVVRSLVSDGSTVLLTTQYLEEADALADEITVIDHGRVIANDTPNGLKRVV